VFWGISWGWVGGPGAEAGADQAACARPPEARPIVTTLPTPAGTGTNAHAVGPYGSKPRRGVPSTRTRTRTRFYSADQEACARPPEACALVSPHPVLCYVKGEICYLSLFPALP